MRICMVVYDVQDFGGLEEYAVNLAAGLRALGHDTCMLSAAAVPPENQYRQRLAADGVPLVEVPSWLSLPASDWSTKVRILDALTVALSPLVYVLGVAHWLAKRGSWRQSLASARGWLRHSLMQRLVGPDRREALARLLLRWWCARWRPDVLHIHGYTTNLLFVIEWAHARGLPVVYEEHQTPDAQFDWWKDFQQTINKAAIVIAVSDKSAEALRSVCGVTQPIVVRGPLMPDPMPGGAPGLRQVRPPTSGLQVTTVARLYVTKGLAYLLEAIARVRESHPDTEFKVYGDGPLREELLEHASRLGLDGPSIFPGAFTARDALRRIMMETDIFVMSSILEGQPLGLVEAMAYGCPIVATSVGGIPELIEDGVNGLLCPPADVACLAARISLMIDRADLRQRLGREARRTYERSGFDAKSIAEHLAAAYTRAIRETRTGV